MNTSIPNLRAVMSGARGPSMPDAACKEEVHRSMWLLAREEHFVERSMLGDKSKWENYWWDVESPDPEYATTVCNSCPVRLLCEDSRPPGVGGIWGGKVFRRKPPRRRKKAHEL